MKIREKRGITLISLVVTIVVLLILAGVSLAMLVGDNGIVRQAANAKQQTEIGEEKEGVGLATTRVLISDNGYSEPTQENLQKAIDEQFGNGQAIVIENGDGSFTVKFDKNNRKYEITSQYEIKEQTQVTDTTPGELTGNGDETSPYLIESIEDLVYFSNSVSNGNKYESKYIKLVNDLDFTSDYSYIDPYRENYFNYPGKLKTALTSGEGFKPIGNIDISDKQNQFYGNFDGNNKKIYGMYINKTSENKFFSGFFAINFGTIKNLALVDSNIYGKSIENPIIGNIAGMNAGKIEKCSSNGNITSIGNTLVTAGGITGILGGTSGTIENCSNSANVSVKNIGIESGGEATIGGIVGKVNAYENQCIKGCVNKGKLEISCDNFGMYIGGIVGYSRCEVIDCYNVSNIEITTNNLTNCGGVIGLNDRSKISNCYNKGNLKIVNSTSKVLQGGICGRIYNGEINNVYNLGNISIENTNPQSCVGGILGTGYADKLQYCNNIGNINIQNELKNVGSIAGDESASTITECKYLKGSYLKAIGLVSLGANTGNITEIEVIDKMPNILDILGSSFRNGSDGYPILNWQ